MAEKERAKKTCKKAKTRGDGVDMFSKTTHPALTPERPKTKKNVPFRMRTTFRSTCAPLV